MNEEELSYMRIIIKGILCTLATILLMSVKHGIATKLSNEIAIMQMQNADLPIMVGNIYNKASLTLTVVCVVIWVLMFWKEIKSITKNDK